MKLGVDTLCWHLRLARGDSTVEDVLEEAAAAGADYVQLGLAYVDDRDPRGLEALARRAGGLGLGLLASGAGTGSPRRGDAPGPRGERLVRSVERAAALGSPICRTASGFFRTDLMGRPDAIEAERRHVVEVLRAAEPAARAAGIELLIENHSDFTTDEYESLVAELGIGVFLDLINPIAVLTDPEPVVARLAPHARAGHVKDFAFRSLPNADGHHRHGFEVLYLYPGEGVADLPALMAALRRGIGAREFFLAVEGLDDSTNGEPADRLRQSLALLRGL